MELRQLRYFVAVADNLNFSRAAESLFVSQSALSKQISDLEDELGAQLFERSNKSVRLTEAGLQLMDEAKSTLFHTERIFAMFERGVLDHRPQYLMIGLEPRLEDYRIIHDVVAETVFQLRMQDSRIRALFFSREPDLILRQVQEGNLHIGLFNHENSYVEQRSSAGLRSIALDQDEFLLVFRQDLDVPDTPEGVRSTLTSDVRLMLLRNEPARFSHIMSLVHEVGGTPQIVFVETRAVMLLNMECGDGVAIIPKSVYHRLNNPKLRAIHFHTPTAKLYLLAVWKQENQLAEQVIQNTVDIYQMSEE